MEKTAIIISIFAFLFSGCNMIGKKQDVQKISALEEPAGQVESSRNSSEQAKAAEPVFKPSKSKEKTPRSEKQEVEIQIMQAKSLIETAMEISKNAEKYAQESYNTSNQANATAEKALEASNKAIESAAQAVKAANEAAERAIAAANESSEKAIAAASKAAKEAMEHADQAAQRAIDAANRAIAAANEASEKAITASNKALAACDQVLAELGRVKATIQAKQLEPVLPDEPKVKPAGSGKSYTVKKGDTLSIISRRFYGDSKEWKKIYDANKSRIKNPSVLIPGTELVIP
ncbi:MAG: LysM peptidoglycan-binding domain-containing protein [Candidatus Omnitrophica bacterium]|nr:LysM peptidoglycan-binding domain-containing protein [Candidatus Omnitrophota bacterium]MCM8828472.1 LysM peptidoglycan-binding domain-containing protein [Candidatus Omnitrophota bacterium]